MALGREIGTICATSPISWVAIWKYFRLDDQLKFDHEFSELASDAVLRLRFWVFYALDQWIVGQQPGHLTGIGLFTL